MPLFHVQDDDRPMYVIANCYAIAIEKWRAVVASENDGEDPGDPAGVHLIADDEDIIVGSGTIESRI